MSYTLSDFSASLEKVDLNPKDIAKVLYAWGHGTGMGTDAGHFKYSDEDVSDWQGGFLMQLTNGSYAYLAGWCDYTGWGCQDGARLTILDHIPTDEEFKEHYESWDAPPLLADWDEDPIDLNRWLSSKETNIWRS